MRVGVGMGSAVTQRRANAAPTTTILKGNRWDACRPRSDKPLLNQRANQLIGHVAALDQAIVNGRGRVQIGDAFWDVEGPDLPVSTPVRVVAVNGMTLKVQQA